MHEERLRRRRIAEEREHQELIRTRLPSFNAMTPAEQAVADVLPPIEIKEEKKKSQ